MAVFGGEVGTCPHCGVLVTFQQQNGANIKNAMGSPIATVLSATCPACNEIVVFLIRADGTGWVSYPPKRPRTVSGTSGRVAEAFREAQLSLAADAPHAAAVMLRRVLASAATDFNVPDRTEDGRFIGLGSRLAQLQSLLLPAAFDAALTTKLLGDGGAHEEAEDEILESLGPIDRATVTRAVEVVQIVLQNLYDIPQKVAALKQ